ncbi:MAG: hypothetical protein ABW140_00265, partial [Candidatus Sedimenticola sp. 6PFRAG1]
YFSLRVFIERHCLLSVFSWQWWQATMFSQFNQPVLDKNQFPTGHIQNFCLVSVPGQQMELI